MVWRSLALLNLLNMLLKKKLKFKKNNNLFPLWGGLFQCAPVEKFACQNFTQWHHEFHVHTNKKELASLIYKQKLIPNVYGKGGAYNMFWRSEMLRLRDTTTYRSLHVLDLKLSQESMHHLQVTLTLAIISTYKKPTGQQVCLVFGWFKSCEETRQIVP